MCYIQVKNIRFNSFYEEKKIQLCLTKQLLNMFKLWREWGIRYKWTLSKVVPDRNWELKCYHSALIIISTNYINLNRKLHTVCIFEGSPRFREGSDKCSPKADHPRKTVGHTPRENFNIQVLREVISSILWDKCWFFLVFFFISLK